MKNRLKRLHQSEIMFKIKALFTRVPLTVNSANLILASGKCNLLRMYISISHVNGKPSGRRKSPLPKMLVFPTVSMDFLLNLDEEWKFQAIYTKNEALLLSFLLVTKNREFGPKSLSSSFTVRA